MKKRALGALLAALVATSALTAPASAATTGPMAFTDVKAGDWYYTAVQTAYAKGLIKGTTATTFEPGATMTRGMVVTILYRLAGNPEHGAGAFADVPEDAWYADAVSWADEHGIAVGYGDGNFGPEDTITREQLATILLRYERKIMGNGTASWIFPLSTFADGATVSPWASDGMCWCVETGLIRGKGAGRLDPQAGATRAEAAAVLVRYMGGKGQ